MGAVGREGPGDDIGEVLDDLPVREEELSLGGVGELERAEDEARGGEFGDHTKHGTNDVELAALVEAVGMSGTGKTIDAHHHLWRYTAAEYGWIDEEMGALRRDFLPSDLRAAMASAGVDGTVAVQARQTLEETRWLLDLSLIHI